MNFAEMLQMLGAVVMMFAVVGVRCAVGYVLEKNNDHVVDHDVAERLAGNAAL